MENQEKLASACKIRKRNIGKAGIVIASLIGFMVQVTQMSILYFEYRTTTQVKFILNNFIRQHAVVVCVRYSDILDRERLMKETGIEIAVVTDYDEAVSQEAKLTVKQIFEYTPKSNEVLDGCFHRTSNWLGKIFNRTLCNRIFNVTRYMTQEFMCYSIEPTNLLALTTESVTQSRFKQFVVYDVAFSAAFFESDHVLPITFASGERFPFVSRSFSDVVTLRRVTGGMREYNLINVFPKDFRIVRLQKPYDTGCIRRNHEDYYMCRRECLVQQFRRRKRTPVTEFLIESDADAYEFKPLSIADLEDSEFENETDQIYDRCNRECYFTPCLMTYTKTAFRTLMFKDLPLVLASMSPMEADVRTQAQATMSFVEYFSFICGCFGTWFGVSFFSLCQVVAFDHKKRKIASSLTHSDELTRSNQVACWTYRRFQTRCVKGAVSQKYPMRI